MCARGNTWAAMHRSVWLNPCQNQTLVKQKHLLHQENLQCRSRFFFNFRNGGDCSHANLLSSSWAIISFSILFFCGFQVTKKKLIDYTVLRSSENALDWSLSKWTCEILNLKSQRSHSCLVRLRNEPTSFKKENLTPHLAEVLSDLNSWTYSADPLCCCLLGQSLMAEHTMDCISDIVLWTGRSLSDCLLTSLKRLCPADSARHKCISNHL